MSKTASAPWRILVASHIGAHHTQREAPNQDAVRQQSTSSATVVAVADGHGHYRHFRSGRGSELASEIAIDETRRWLGEAGAISSPEGLCASARDDLVPQLWQRWRTAVERDVDANPFTEAEEKLRRPGDAPEIAYGATLLITALSATDAIFVQIGDGDIVAVTRDGRTWRPVPGDPLLFAHRTTSLAQKDAVESFRVAVVNLQMDPLDLILVATDGFANAQSGEDWFVRVGTDIARMKREKGVQRLADELPRWVEKCASTEGSGDDTSVALIVANPARGAAQLGSRVANLTRAHPLRSVTAAALLGITAVAAVVLGLSGSQRPVATGTTATSGSTTTTQSTIPPTSTAPPTTTVIGANHTKTLVIRHGGVEAVDPHNGLPVRVSFPSDLRAARPTQAIQVGKFVLVLAGRRVWRVDIGAPARSRPATTPLLASPAPPLRSTRGKVTVSGRKGLLLYELTPQNMAVTCLPRPGLPARVCAGAIARR